jgi:putative ABC transport system permease protein
MNRILKQYFRNLATNRINASITIFGFSISIAVVISLVFFVLQEKSYDRCYKNLDSTYIVVTTKNESFVEEDAKDILTNKFPQIISACRYYNFKTIFLFNKAFFDGQLITTDEGFFDVFSTHFIYGNKKTAFSNPNSIVLTDSFAKKIFANIHPIGQTIKTVGGKVFQVTGIVKDLPKNSSISADCFINYKSKIHRSEENNVPITKLFIVLHPGTNIDGFQKDVSKTLVESSKILSNKEMMSDGSIEWKLIPFKSAYFDTEIRNDHLQHANIRLIQIISVISFIILMLAIINYINLTTAEGISRIKEIGIRKTNGAGKRNIFYQFLIESLITCVIASILAFFLTPRITPIFEIILSKPLHFVELSFKSVFIILLLIFALGILAGLFPAFIASRYSPVRLIKSKSKDRNKSFTFRNALNTLQFTITIVFSICLIVILKQIHYVQNRNIGFDTSHLITVDYPNNLNQSNAVRDYLKQNPNILDVSFSRGNPEEIGFYSDMGNPIKTVSIMSSDNNFIETFKLKLLLGRNFNYPSNIKECLITENAYKESGWDNLDNKIFENCNVVGVVNTFNTDDLHLFASNVMINNSADNYSSVNIRLSPNDITESLKYIKQGWATFFPEFGFRYSFYDEWIETSFLKEENHARIAFVFGILSIILSCLGLYGLSNYYLKQKVKEIGIRKINGAKSIEILSLVNKGFLKWILVAFIIACPVAILILNKWLSNFAYKTTLHFWIFIVSGLAVIIIALLTISWKSLEAANTNPIKALRYE